MEAGNVETFEPPTCQAWALVKDDQGRVSEYLGQVSDSPRAEGRARSHSRSRGRRGGGRNAPDEAHRESAAASWFQ
jgi:hypothetical protein